MDANFRLVESHEISGQEKLLKVTYLVQELRTDLQVAHLLPQDRNHAIDQLKVFARDSHNNEPLFTPQGINILVHHSFNSPSQTTSQAALRCLANTLQSGGDYTRKLFVDSGYSHQAVARLRTPKKDDEFLMSRILFLTAHGTSQDFAYLIEKHNLAKYINENIARHAKIHDRLGKKMPSHADDLAMSETLRLLIVVTHFCPEYNHMFHKSIGNIVKIIALRNVCFGMANPISHLTGALYNLDLDAPKAFTSKSELKNAIKKLTDVVDQGLRTSTSAYELERAIEPALTVLTQISRSCPVDLKISMGTSFLPIPESDKYEIYTTHHLAFSQDLLSHRLIQQVRVPTSKILGRKIRDLLEEVSGVSGEEFNRNFGIESRGFKSTRSTPIADSFTSGVGRFRSDSSRSFHRLASKSTPCLREAASQQSHDIPVPRLIRPTLTRAKSDSEVAAFQASDRLRELLSSKACEVTGKGRIENFGLDVAVALNLRQYSPFVVD